MSTRKIEVLREVVVKLAKLLAGQSIEVTQRGTQAFARADRTGKPILVNIPFIPDDASDGFIAAIQGFIDHEVGHVLFTDWKIQTKIRNGKLHSCWNVIEDPFVERMMTKKFPGTAHNLDQVGEYFLKHITEPALKKAADEIEAFNYLLVPVIRAKSGQAVFDRWCVANKIYELPKVKAMLDRMGAKVLTRLPNITTTKESVEIAKELYDAINPPPPPVVEEDEQEEEKKPPAPPAPPAPPSASAPEPEETEETEADEPGEPTSSEPSEAEASEPAPSEPEEDEDPAAPELEPEAEEESEVEPDAESGEAETDPTMKSEPEEDEAEADAENDEGDSSDEDEDGEVGAASSAAGEDETGEDDGEDESATMQGAESTTPGSPERPVEPKDFMDALSQLLSEESAQGAAKAPYVPFSKDLDKIIPYEFEASSFQDSMLVRMDDKVGRLIGVMQKDIERMMASKSRVQQVPGYRSGRLHASSLHRLTTNDDRVFQRRQVSQAKETVVSLLIDNSGSMSGHKMTTAMESAYALSLTLERVGIKHEVIGFTTGGYYDKGFSEMQTAAETEGEKIGREFSRTQPIYMPIYKGFGERLTPPVKKRLAHAAATQKFLANNIDGECVEVATKRLLGEKADRRILIVLSDGHPAGCDDQAAGFQHLQDMVKKTASQGVETIGIGIQSDAVKHFYPKHVIIKDVAELPSVVMGHLKQVLAAS